MSKIILASTPPRRKELLEKAGIDFIVDASSIDEILDNDLPIKERLEKLACDKVRPIHQNNCEDIVIAADTVVYFDNHIIGKASDESDAKRILSLLSHHKHTVYTAVAIYFGNELVTFVEQTDVYFKDISHLIDDYILSKDWVGKAGAYGIQGKADVFVEKVVGDKDNVIGLPLTKVVKLFQEKGII